MLYQLCSLKSENDIKAIGLGILAYNPNNFIKVLRNEFLHDEISISRNSFGETLIWICTARYINTDSVCYYTYMPVKIIDGE